MNFLKALFPKKEEENVFEALEEIIDEQEESCPSKSAVSESHEMVLLKNLLNMRDTRAHEVMIPSVDIRGVEIQTPFDDFVRLLAKDKFTRYPVYKKDIDHIVGIIHVKDVLYALIQQKRPKIEELMSSSILFVSPAMKVLDLLQEMQIKQIQMAIVIDEFGGTDGVISMEDLLEEIVGEIEDEHDHEDEEEKITKEGKDSLIVGGKVFLEDLEEILTVPLSLDEEFDIDTIGGLVSFIAGRIPNKMEVINHSSGLKFKVLERDSRKIQKIQILNVKPFLKEEN
ncbi:MAG: transporter associated domain-containing protein [Alphaproteobacteria bacterium]|nr:transporter associated domain-containing protein [Alphaproteobacteria bacterium]